MSKKFPDYHQRDAMDCGPTCLRMIAKHYGRTYSLKTLREKSFITREGVSMLGISDAAEAIGFRTTGVKISFEQLFNDVPLPCILHWNQNHFVVCYKIKKKRQNFQIYISDPASGLLTYTKDEFFHCWISTEKGGKETGTALALQPAPDFYEHEDEREKASRNLKYFFRYLRPYKLQILQLALGMIVGMVLNLIFPFLTQSMVDTGIGTHNLNFISLVLIAQLVLFVTQYIA